MIYRPQWAYRTPEGYRDEPWHQCISASAQPNPLGSLAGNTQVGFVIGFDRDADFLVLGMVIDAGKNFRSLGYQFIDAFGYPLSDDFCGSCLYAMPLGQNPDRGGSFEVTFDPPHYVPAGGNWQLKITNYDNVSQPIPDMELAGIKRSKVVCK